MKRIKYGTQKISEADIEAVVGVLKNSNLTQGQEIPSFEEEIDLRLGHDVHSVVLNSATSALHVGYLSLGLGFGDLVWTSANTFVATASAARMCGADIDFVDIDEQSLNMDMRCLAAKLEHCVQQGDSLPDIVVPVRDRWIAQL